MSPAGGALNSIVRRLRWNLVLRRTNADMRKLNTPIGTYARRFAFWLNLVGGFFCIIGAIGFVLAILGPSDRLAGALISLGLTGLGLAVTLLLVPCVPAIVRYQYDSYGGSHVSELRSRAKPRDSVVPIASDHASAAPPNVQEESSNKSQERSRER